VNRLLHVGIFCFGIAGGALATLLARAGLRVTILEQAASLRPVGAGFLLQPSVQKVLAELGMLDSIIGRSARIERLDAFTHRGQRLTELRYESACAYGVQRGVVFSALYDAALASGAETILAAEKRPAPSISARRSLSLHPPYPICGNLRRERVGPGSSGRVQ